MKMEKISFNKLIMKKQANCLMEEPKKKKNWLKLVLDIVKLTIAFLAGDQIGGIL